MPEPAKNEKQEGNSEPAATNPDPAGSAAANAPKEAPSDGPAPLQEGLRPLFISQQSQEIFGCRVDQDVTEENPYKLIPKQDILDDFKNRAAVCDFHPVKAKLLVSHSVCHWEGLRGLNCTTLIWGNTNACLNWLNLICKKNFRRYFLYGQMSEMERMKVNTLSSLELDFFFFCQIPCSVWHQGTLSHSAFRATYYTVSEAVCKRLFSVLRLASAPHSGLVRPWQWLAR